MPVKDVFQTIEGNSKGLFKDKGSSFISYIFPVFDESVVKEHLLVLKKEHPKARHICYAYRWGPDREYNRIHDDGEPNGTAGKPILNQLRSHELENTLVAVVRYFGGTLLGVPGLIQAYKSAALNAIQQASIISMRRNTYFHLSTNYVQEKQLQTLIKKLEGVIVKKTFGECIDLLVAFPISSVETIPVEFKQISREMQWDESTTCTFVDKDHF